MRVAVILVGDELLAGHTRDANGHFLAQRVTQLGHRVRCILVVPDEARAITDAVDAMLRVADLVFVAGGLGPTHDDRTTDALAQRFHRRLVVDEPSWQRLRARYGPREPPPDVVESARKMVMVPEGAEVLENPAGAAASYVLREDSAAIVVLPGVPAELQAIFERAIEGRLLPRAQGGTLLEVDVHMAEAVFAKALAQVAERFGDVEIGSYPHFGETRVTLRFRGEPERAEAALAAFLDALPTARDSLKRR